jgi:excisionase family DNA binding protein
MKRPNMVSNEPRATYKVREAACVAGVGDAAIRRGIAQGRIPHLRFGRNILIPKTAFHRWLDSCGATASKNTQVTV